MSGGHSPLIEDLASGYVSSSPAQSAVALAKLNPADIAIYLESISKHDACAVLDGMDPDLSAKTISRLSDEATHRILSLIDPAKLAIVLSRLDKDEQDKNLLVLENELADEIRDIMSYPPNTAGRIMDPRYLVFGYDTTVREVSKKLTALRKRKVLDILVLSEDGSPERLVPVQQVLLSESNIRVRDLTAELPPTVNDMALREEVVEFLAKNQVTSLPVVNSDNKVVGVIRYADLMHAVEEEATVDIQTMVGAGKEERALSSPLLSVRKRLPWLNINLLTAFIAAGVVGLFENVIAQVTALAVLLPVVAGQSGNTGAQALAVTMRGLALREVRASQWKRLLLKESLAGAMNGVAIAIVTAVGVYIWSQSIGLALVICVSMVIAMIIAGASGAAIPVILTKLG